MLNPSSYDRECNGVCKIDEYVHINKCSCKECLIGTLILACQDEILNASKTSRYHKKPTRE